MPVAATARVTHDRIREGTPWLAMELVRGGTLAPLGGKACIGDFVRDAGRELHVVYHLRSLTHNRFVTLETSCPDSDPHVPSATSVYPTNDWHEREAYDFFGVIFDGHPYLTRIQMPDDWPGHPQRKDYPLGGIPVEYKGAVTPPPDERRWYS